MTKKDYIQIASIIKDNTSNKMTINLEGEYLDTIDMLVKDSLVNDFVIMFKKNNERFDKDRFIKACQ
jgi:hypothetical protein